MYPGVDQGQIARRILLVEDDALSLKLMRDVLRSRGYSIDEATNGPAGLALAKQALPDLIVIDIGLPCMDGIEVTKCLRSDDATAGIPILVVSAYATPGDEDRARAAGCSDFLTKPLSYAQFASIVDCLSGGSPGSVVDQSSSASGREK